MRCWKEQCCWRSVWGCSWSCEGGEPCAQLPARQELQVHSSSRGGRMMNRCPCTNSHKLQPSVSPCPCPVSADVLGQLQPYQSPPYVASAAFRCTSAILHCSLHPVTCVHTFCRAAQVLLLLAACGQRLPLQSLQIIVQQRHHRDLSNKRSRCQHCAFLSTRQKRQMPAALQAAL